MSPSDKFDDHRHCDSGDLMFFVGLWSYKTTWSCDVMGGSPSPQIRTLQSLMTIYIVTVEI